MRKAGEPQTPTKISGSPENIKAESAELRRSPRAGAVKKAKKITETYLHNSGLYYLQRFAASTGQFRRVMQRKIDKSCRDHPDQDRESCVAMLAALIEKFQDLGLLDDEGYARGAVNSLRGRGLSERAILMKLQMKGLPEAQIREALQTYNTESESTPAAAELTAALKLARKKKVGPYAVQDYDHAKALAAFARAGFSYELAQRILSMTAADLDP